MKIDSVKKEEILIKQNRLKVLLDIIKLLSAADSEDVDKSNIINYTLDEENNLVLDIMNLININELDSIHFSEEGELYKETIEDSIRYLFEKNDNPVKQQLLSEFIYAVANYDIEDLISYEIIQKYLKMIDVIVVSYDDLDLNDCKRI